MQGSAGAWRDPLGTIIFSPKVQVIEALRGQGTAGAMSFFKLSLLEIARKLRLSPVQRDVLLAALPGTLVMTGYFGPGTLFNILLGGLVALACRYAVAALRVRDAVAASRDLSALITSTLLCIALPPYAPWWLISLGVLSSELLGKQVFGGQGYHPFNPAMVGYAILLISFPAQMSAWPSPRGLAEVPGFADTIRHLIAPGTIDAVTAATPLDLLRQNTGLLFEELLLQSPELTRWAGVGWFEVNLAFLLGGLFLLRRRIFSWHAPIAMLAAVTLCALIGYDGGSSRSGGSVIFHLFSGATMFAAFFIITDPFCCAKSKKGKIIFGSLIGFLVYLIRVSGDYPDAFAFAVLIVNFCTPFIDYCTKPKAVNTQGTES